MFCNVVEWCLIGIGTALGGICAGEVGAAFGAALGKLVFTFLRCSVDYIGNNSVLSSWVY